MEMRIAHILGEEFDLIQWDLITESLVQDVKIWRFLQFATNLIALTISGYPLLSAEIEEIEDARKQEAVLLTKWQRIMGINYEIVVGQLTFCNLQLVTVFQQAV